MTAVLILSPSARAMCARHPKAYLRERAVALVKIADGRSPRQVAQAWLLRARDPSTVNRWLRAWLRQLCAAYGTTRHLTLVWDNWPVHTHPDVVARAAAERITLLALPTYAPWLNPIEKLWGA